MIAGGRGSAGDRQLMPPRLSVVAVTRASLRGGGSSPSSSSSAAVGPRGMRALSGVGVCLFPALGEDPGVMLPIPPY
jgi:hypothetical protein